jgi:ribosomal protein S2
MLQINNLNFFYKTGMHFGGNKSLDGKLNLFNLVFFLGKRKSFFIINYQHFIYNMRICLFFLYRLVSLRGKILGFDDRFYVRRCLIFFFNRANQNYVIKHWIGGTLTNFRNFQTFFFQITKGLLSVKKYYDLFIYYYGLKNMQQMPSLVILTNPSGENIAFQETFRLAIPVVSLVNIDTKNTFGITFPIPSNTTTKKSLFIFYSIFGDSLIYGFLKPVSYFFSLFIKRLKKIRQNIFLNQKIYQTPYNHIIHLFFKKTINNFKIMDIFFKNKYLKYLQKRKIFNLKFFFNIGNKKKIHKKFFKNSFFILWSLKKVLNKKKKKEKYLKRFLNIKKSKKEINFSKFLKF